MKKLHKTVGVLLAILMILSLSVVSFAAETGKTLTIKNSVSGYTYSAYQVFSGTLSTDKKT